MKKTWLITVGAMSVAAVLAACGGGDDAPAPPPVTSEVPASASATTGGFIDYLKQLVVAAADTLEPVDVSAVTPPTSESADPDVVD